MEYDLYFLKTLANSINAMKNSVCKEGYKLSSEALKIIKEMRENLNDIIVEDMYKWNIDLETQNIQ